MIDVTLEQPSVAVVASPLLKAETNCWIGLITAALSVALDAPAAAMKRTAASNGRYDLAQPSDDLDSPDGWRIDGERRADGVERVHGMRALRTDATLVAAPLLDPQPHQPVCHDGENDEVDQ